MLNRIIFTSRPLVHQTNLRLLKTDCRLRSRALSDPENKGERQKGVNFETLGSWNNRIDMPILVEQSIKKGKLIPRIPIDEVGHTSLIGRRKLNEDRTLIRALTDDILLFGIFDGHGGPLAADFMVQLLEKYMKYLLTRCASLNEILEKTFCDLNNLLARHLFHYFAENGMTNTGTTATVCLICNGNELTLGHVGDTRAILCRGGSALRLTKDHDPDNPEEKKRIKNLGGKITRNSIGVPQVEGRLNMTRSIGDMDLKGHGVVAKPFIKKIEIKHGKDACLILLSDGVTYVLNDQEVANIVISCKDPSEAANFITDQALQYGSEDNVTALVIPFGAWGKYQKTTQAIPYSFCRNVIGDRY